MVNPIVITYTPPATKPLRDLAGNLIAGIVAPSSSSPVAISVSLAATASLAATISLPEIVIPPPVTPPAAFKPIAKVPNLPSNIAIVDPATGFPSTAFQRWWQLSVEVGLNALISNANVAAAAAAANAAAATAQAAAEAASTAAATAQTAGDGATAAAAAAAAQAAANAREAALVNSSISPSSVLTATPTTITIAAHNRVYADGTTVAVSGGTVAATGSGDVDYVSYSDPARSGGSVGYLTSTTAPTQGADIHVVGAITIPATGSATGGSGPRPPGYVIP